VRSPVVAVPDEHDAAAWPDRSREATPVPASPATPPVEAPEALGDSIEADVAISRAAVGDSPKVEHVTATLASAYASVTSSTVQSPRTAVQSPASKEELLSAAAAGHAGSGGVLRDFIANEPASISFSKEELPAAAAANPAGFDDALQDFIDNEGMAQDDAAGSVVAGFTASSERQQEEEQAWQPQVAAVANASAGLPAALLGSEASLEPLDGTPTKDETDEAATADIGDGGLPPLQARRHCQSRRITVHAQPYASGSEGS
jgi:hypothetical protein